MGMKNVKMDEKFRRDLMSWFNFLIKNEAKIRDFLFRGVLEGEDEAYDIWSWKRFHEIINIKDLGQRSIYFRELFTRMLLISNPSKPQQRSINYWSNVYYHEEWCEHFPTFKEFVNFLGFMITQRGIYFEDTLRSLFIEYRNSDHAFKEFWARMYKKDCCDSDEEVMMVIPIKGSLLSKQEYYVKKSKWFRDIFIKVLSSGDDKENIKNLRQYWKSEMDAMWHEHFSNFHYFIGFLDFIIKECVVKTEEELRGLMKEIGNPFQRDVKGVKECWVHKYHQTLCVGINKHIMDLRKEFPHLEEYLKLLETDDYFFKSGELAFYWDILDDKQKMRDNLMIKLDNWYALSNQAIDKVCEDTLWGRNTALKFLYWYHDKWNKMNELHEHHPNWKKKYEYKAEWLVMLKEMRLNLKEGGFSWYAKFLKEQEPEKTNITLGAIVEFTFEIGELVKKYNEENNMEINPSDVIKHAVSWYDVSLGDLANNAKLDNKFLDIFVKDYFHKIKSEQGIKKYETEVNQLVKEDQERIIKNSKEIAEDLRKRQRQRKQELASIKEALGIKEDGQGKIKTNHELCQYGDKCGTCETKTWDDGIPLPPEIYYVDDDKEKEKEEIDMEYTPKLQKI